MQRDIKYEHARYPLDERGTELAKLARTLHRDHLDPEAREFFADSSPAARALLVALYEGRAVGYVSVDVLGSDEEMTLKWLLVDPAFRGEGIGTGLLLTLIRHALHEGVTRLVLETWRESPVNLESWYLRMGFRWVRDQDSIPSDYLVLDIEKGGAT